MAPLIETLGINQLNASDRQTLLEQIWDSLVDHPDELEIPQWHKDELDRRLAANEANPEAGSTWEEVRARLEPRP